MKWLFNSTDEAIQTVLDKYEPFFYFDLDKREDGWHAEICYDGLDGNKLQVRTTEFPTILEAIADLLDTLDNRTVQMEADILKQIKEKNDEQPS